MTRNYVKGGSDNYDLELYLDDETNPVLTVLT